MKPKIAVCTHMIPSIEEVAALARENGSLAIDYSLDSQNLHACGTDIERLHDLTRGSELEIRYHCFFGDVEIGHTDARHGDTALAKIKEAIDHVQRFGGRYVTLHVGLNSRVHGELDWENALKNLRELVSFGKQRGVTVCLENLKSGFTSEPEPFLKLIELSGASVTFDIGHAISSDAGKNGACAEEFVRLVSPYIVNAHIYEAEEAPGHIAPKDLNTIEPVLRELIKTDCGWWVIELGDQEEIRRTRNLIQSFLSRYSS